ncbi:MAG: GPP34 family phosphoprotein [Gemmatimonadetes bacterium]|nr:GPP34 family phosphoprotein [Gemmatimonadota bacterium]
MAVATEEGLHTLQLSLPEELILMLLNEENGYFHQVPGWRLNCAVVGAVLAELSLLSRIDTDLESLFLVDASKTGDPALDPILEEIASESVQRNAQYWIERLAHRAESVIDLTLDRLVELKILEHHDGDFWTVARTVRHSDMYGDPEADTAGQFIKTRIGKAIFTDAIPYPRDSHRCLPCEYLRCLPVHVPAR